MNTFLGFVCLWFFYLFALKDAKQLTSTSPAFCLPHTAKQQREHRVSCHKVRETLQLSKPQQTNWQFMCSCSLFTIARMVYCRDKCFLHAPGKSFFRYSRSEMAKNVNEIGLLLPALQTKQSLTALRTTHCSPQFQP